MPVNAHDLSPGTQLFQITSRTIESSMPLDLLDLMVLVLAPAQGGAG